MQENILVYHKGLERRAAYSEKSTADFEEATNITSDISIDIFSLLLH